MMRHSRSVFALFAAILFVGSIFVAPPAQSAAAKPESPPAENPAAVACLACHGNKGFAMPGADGKMRNLHVEADKFGKSVHGKRSCVDCHKDITEIPHKTGVTHKVGCVSCHEDLWDAAKQDKKTVENARLGVVVEQIDHYMKSIHARPNKEDQSRTNATCYNCHDAHYVYPAGSPERTAWRLEVPNKCGSCHVKEREVYATSVHGNAVLKEKNPYAAICSDCHTTHSVEKAKLDSAKLAITRNCGNCHADSIRSYAQTYHGQVNTLGYAYTAKCFDCHGDHGIKRVSDPASKVHPDNRLQTCQQCHKDATKGFVTFQPHGNTHDFERYPFLYVTSKFMIALLFGVFAFFWSHSLLWFYREHKDRQKGELRPHVLAAELPGWKGKHFQRFALGWRIAHLLFALSVMTLVLSGMAVFFGETQWAKSFMQWVGGPRNAAIIHRVSAAIMLGIFFIHLIVVIRKLAPQWRTFDWFGPNSMVPNWKDLQDAIAMFSWFFGKGPRPALDRWTYWEKFDYWAVFWGMGIIGISGMMLAFPNVTASVLPGWVFNVATLIHGEEAILAAVFLFTVHFFNNHLRPDKHPPPDIVMFTGAVSLEEFKREHGLEYNRLVASGELEKHLVDAPSRPMTIGSRVLGIVLLAIGLALLVMVFIGFFTNMGNGR